MPSAAVSQLNVRMPTSLKDRGNATLALVGSSPVKIVRQLWEKLAQGGEAYQQIARVLASDAQPEAVCDEESTLYRATHLFEDLGASFGLDISTFQPDLRPTHEILEEIEWERLNERGLA